MSTIGDRLWLRICAAYNLSSVQTCKDAGMYSPTVTAGKMTGMILAGYSEPEVEEILKSSDALADVMIDCVVAILRQEGRTDV